MGLAQPMESEQARTIQSAQAIQAAQAVAPAQDMEAEQAMTSAQAMLSVQAMQSASAARSDHAGVGTGYVGGPPHRPPPPIAGSGAPERCPVDARWAHASGASPARPPCGCVAGVVAGPPMASLVSRGGRARRRFVARTWGTSSP